MHPLLIALALLAALYFGIKMFARTDPKLLVRRLKLVSGGSLLAGAVVMAVTGRWGAAVSLAIVGFSLAGQEFFRSIPSPRPAKGRRRSEVRSTRLVMWLDHETGAMGGRVLNGRFAGVALDALSDRDLLWLRDDLRGDPDSSGLIEAYLDRRTPGWRPADENGPTQRNNGRPHPMTEEEAYQILGLAPASDEESVRRAHRSLMKRLHPDQGGSSYLAARVNEARDLLLRKPRRPA